MELNKDQQNFFKALYLDFLLLSFTEQKKFFENEQRFYKSCAEGNIAVTVLIEAMSKLCDIDIPNYADQKSIEDAINTLTMMQQSYAKKCELYVTLKKTIDFMDWHLVVQSVRANMVSLQVKSAIPQIMVPKIEKATFYSFLAYQRAELENIVK